MAVVALGHRRAPYRTVTVFRDTSGIVYSGPCLLVTCKVYAAAADAKAVVTDSLNGTGNKLDDARAKAGDWLPGGESGIMTPAEVGLYCEITGTGAEACVRYIPLPEE